MISAADRKIKKNYTERERYQKWIRIIIKSEIHYYMNENFKKTGGVMMEAIMKDGKPVTDLGNFIRRFDFETVELNEMNPITAEGKLAGIRIGNDAYFVHRRFINTMMSIFGFAESLFQYFSPEELFARIIERKKDVPLRICIDQKLKQLNGVSDVKKETLPLPNVCNIVREDPRVTDIVYDPKTTAMEAIFKLDDEWENPRDSRYRNQFHFTYPVDHCNTPTIALGLVRVICSNGLVARKRCFETDLVIENQHGRHLRQLLRSFNNRNGFDALKERLLVAQNTKASVNELLGVANMFKKNIKDPLPFLDRLNETAGNPEHRYGQSRLENIRSRHRRELPTDASVLDLVNILTEVSTHFMTEKRSMLDGYAVNMLAGEFDLEELAENRRSAQNYYFRGLPHED